MSHGHAIGLDHTQTPGSLMNPVIDPNALSAGLGRWDTDQLVARYGPAVSPPQPPAPQPQPPGSVPLPPPGSAVGYLDMTPYAYPGPDGTARTMKIRMAAIFDGVE